MAASDGERQHPNGVPDAQIQEYAARSSGRLQAQISSFKNGLQVFPRISIIRIRSPKTNLMILEDYMPIIGEINGDIELIGKDSFHAFRGIHGFFCHDHNVFFLIMKEDADAG